MNNNVIIIQRLISSLPANIKLVDYLMDKLSICRESAYRRVRGDMPFTFDQIEQLSIELGFSMDEIAFLDNKNILFKQYAGESLSPKDSFIFMLEKYYGTLIKQSQSSHSYIIITMNRLLEIMVVTFPHLFRFLYYKWEHQISNVPLNYYLSETIVPPEVVSLCDKLSPHIQNVKNVTHIIDPQVFQNTLSEINYYYKRNLITKEELTAIQGDLVLMLDYAEDDARSIGCGHGMSNHDYYLSAIPVQTNSLYSSWDSYSESCFFVYPGYPLYTMDKYGCALHNKWIDSIKKYATMISNSNEALQAELYVKGRIALNNMFL